MKVNRSHIPWVLLFLVGTAVSALYYAAIFAPQWLPFPVAVPALLRAGSHERHTIGGSPLGLIYGILAAAIFVFAALLGLRKKRRTWPLGNVRTWLRAHIWLSMLTIPLVLFHCGFHAGGPHTVWLLILYGIVMGSGLLGLYLQAIMPRLMTNRLPREVVFEQIPHLRGVLFERALVLRSEVRSLERALKLQPATVIVTGFEQPESGESADVVGHFLDEECLPYLRSTRQEARRHRLADARAGADLFRLLKLQSSDRLAAAVAQMEDWCNDRRDMDLQVRLHYVQHGWLLFHVPFSFALIVLTAWHAYIEFAYL